MLTHVLVLIECLLLTDLKSFGLIGEQVLLAMRGHPDCCLVFGLAFWFNLSQEGLY
jgi:hypothetical protein